MLVTSVPVAVLPRFTGGVVVSSARWTVNDGASTGRRWATHGHDGFRGAWEPRVAAANVCYASELPDADAAECQRGGAAKLGADARNGALECAVGKRPPALGSAEHVVYGVSRERVQTSGFLKGCDGEGNRRERVPTRTVVPEYAGLYAGYGGVGTGWLGTKNGSAVVPL